MKNSIVAVVSLFLILEIHAVSAVKVYPPLQDASQHEKVVSNNPAVQLGSPNRESTIYHPGWRYSRRRRAYWHDQHPSRWKKTKQPQQKRTRSAR